MKKVILEIDDRYADILSITAVGTSYSGTSVSLFAFETKNGNRIVIRNDGKSEQFMDGE